MASLLTPYPVYGIKSKINLVVYSQWKQLVLFFGMYVPVDRTKEGLLIKRIKKKKENEQQ